MLFNSPAAVAVDKGGNVFVADTRNNVIREIRADTTTITFAGSTAGAAGSSDGSGTDARFNVPGGLALDPASAFLYVADGGNSTIRKISLSATSSVTTIAGIAGVRGFADGPVGKSLLNQPSGVSVSSIGEIYVADTGNGMLRKISSTSVVSLLAGGVRAMIRSEDGFGANATFAPPGDLTAIPDLEAVLVTDLGNSSGAIRIAIPADPRVVTQPQSQTIGVGTTATLSATILAPGVIPVAYRWSKNGVSTTDAGRISGSTQNTLTISGAQFTDEGTYTLEISNAFGKVVTAPATIAVTGIVSRLSNLSILTDISTPGDSFTMGYIVGGTGTGGTKPVVIRAAGPSLRTFGITAILEDPKLELFTGSTKTAENDNWGGTPELMQAMAGVGAFPYSGATSRDAAIVTTIPSSQNSARVSAVGNGTGTVIAEIYDATPPGTVTASTPRLINVSVLKNIGAGLTAGFVVAGTSTKTVLIRAVGPTLGTAPFNVPGVASDPQLSLYGQAGKIGENDNWGGTAPLTAAFQSVGAFTLPAGSRDAAFLATVIPGSYTVQVSGVGGTTGTVLIEIYEMP